MSAILISFKVDDPAAWTAALGKRLPGAEFRVWPEVGDVRDIDVAVVWRYPAGDLARYPNLRLICSLGAGVDHIMADPGLPAGVPIARIVDPDLTQGMCEYILLAALHYHRCFPQYAEMQRQRRWSKLPPPKTSARRVGVMGTGVIGGEAARWLARVGFSVAGWSRAPRTLGNIETFHGADGFPRFLARTDILVCVLPLTPDTRGIINARTLAQLPQGAFVINAARGGHVVADDLLAALDSGHIAGATLDVFEPEPLPADHRFWTHPKVTVTPHIAALTNPETAADQIAENIARVRAGRKLLNLIDPRAGY